MTIQTLIAQLKLHELVLMFLGVLLFIALLIILVAKAIGNKNIKSLIAFFLLPILMIGYPSIKSFSFMELKVEIKDTARELAQNPADTTAMKKLNNLLLQVDYNRAAGDPDALVEIANAHSTLGNYDSALQFAEKAVTLNPADENAQSAKADIEKKRVNKRDYYTKIQQLNAIISSNTPPTQQDVNKVSDILTSIQPPVYVDEKSVLTVAKAFSFVDEKQKALQTAQRAATHNPNDPVVRAATENILTDSATAPAIDKSRRELLLQSELSKAPANRMIVKKTYPIN